MFLIKFYIDRTGRIFHFRLWIFVKDLQNPFRIPPKMAHTRKTDDLRIKNKLRSKSFQLQIDRGDCQLQFPPRLVVVRSNLVELPANNREYAKVRMRANRVVDSFLLVAPPNCYIFGRKKSANSWQVGEQILHWSTIGCRAFFWENLEWV